MEGPSGATYLQSRRRRSLIQHGINVVLFMSQFWDVAFNLWLSAFSLSSGIEKEKKHTRAGRCFGLCTAWRVTQRDVLI